MGTITMTSRLVGVLGRKVRPIITTSMIVPLKTKCLMQELILNVSFIRMIEIKKETGVWLQSILDLKTFIKQMIIFSIIFNL